MITKKNIIKNETSQKIKCHVTWNVTNMSLKCQWKLHDTKIKQFFYFNQHFTKAKIKLKPKFLKIEISIKLKGCQN